jgi:uncharacterized protein
VSVFADTSALVKLYANENGHDWMRAIGEPIVISALTRVELPSALWAKQRRGEARPASVGLAVAKFEADYYGTDDSEPRFDKVLLADHVLAGAARVAARVGLRPGDAIQLASALVARHADRHVATMATFDVRLRDAAAIEGFHVLPSALPS